MSKQKAKGTEFESGFVRWWRRVTGDERAHRAALAGSADEGDVHGLYAHGCTGIAELKNYADWKPSDLVRWEAETEAERGNAGADFALLVVHRRGADSTGRSASFGTNWCFVRLAELPVLHLGLARRMWPGSPVDDVTEDTWARLRLSDVAAMVMAGMEEIV